LKTNNENWDQIEYKKLTLWCDIGLTREFFKLKKIKLKNIYFKKIKKNKKF